ncbi:hypothetical protein EVAR_89479_1 [Eumeta japonica]|uniref:ATP-dependent DNA helicase n=1 Tax=Eumeta variegata TaxID=151549 RepID=A0A4C1XJP7_EUMVA|nr:hypothetical protein EVAR_89479_1 [Eumeta japonica]
MHEEDDGESAGAIVEYPTADERGQANASQREHNAQNRSVDPVLVLNLARRSRIRRAVLAEMLHAAFNYNIQIDYSMYGYIGMMDAICPHCDAANFPGETPGMCCANGKKGDDGYHINIPMIDPRTVQLGMTAPNREIHDLFDRELQREQEFNSNDLRLFVQLNITKLNIQQKHVYDTIVQAVSNNAGGLYFLDAPDGTGKTFVVSLILATIRSEQKIALALTSLGIAATLLEGGRTAHSALKLPLNVQNYRNHDWLRERAILAPKNIHINVINFQIQAKLPGVVTTYKSIDSVMNQDEAMNF